MGKYLAAAAIGAVAGYIAAKGLPDRFSINIPYGPKLSFNKKSQ